MGISNREIVDKFIAANAIDFEAIGKVVADLGPAISGSDMGFRVVLAGRPFMLACLMPAADIRELVGELSNVAVQAAMTAERAE